MAKAKVWTHVGDGLYQVSYYQDTSYAKTRAKELEQRLKDLEIRIYGPNGLIDVRDSAELEYEDKSVQFFDALNAWAECAKQPGCDAGALAGTVRTLGSERAELGFKVSQALLGVAAAKATILNVQGELAYLENTTQEEDFRTMWCVEFPAETEGPIANGTIAGTAESYGAKNTSGGLWLPSAHANLLGKFEIDYDCERDHKVTAISGQSIASAICNTLLFLNAMTNNPTYAVGTLQSKNEEDDTASVELFGETPVSDHPTGYPFIDGQFSIMLTEVPVEYQDCGVKIFEVGDQVVVRFEAAARGTPTVIGFATNPRECRLVTVTYTVQGTGGINGEASQTGPAPFNPTPVAAMQTDSGWAFTHWLDGSPNPYRDDGDQEESITFTAVFEAILGDPFPETIDCEISQNAGGWSQLNNVRWGHTFTVGNVSTEQWIGGEFSCSWWDSGTPPFSPSTQSISAAWGVLMVKAENLGGSSYTFEDTSLNDFPMDSFRASWQVTTTEYDNTLDLSYEQNCEDAGDNHLINHYISLDGLGNYTEVDTNITQTCTVCGWGTPIYDGSKVGTTSAIASLVGKFTMNTTFILAYEQLGKTFRQPYYAYQTVNPSIAVYKRLGAP